MIPPGGRRQARGAALAAALAASAYACGDDLYDPVACSMPVVSHSAVARNETNVLSVFVTTIVAGADSVAVRFGDPDGQLDGVTPPSSVRDGAALVPVLGLFPLKPYHARVVAFNGCGTTEGELLAFETDALPADLPAYAAGGGAPAPGFVVFAAGSYGLAIDNTGRVVWYHRFAVGPGLNFQPQPNGRYVARPPAPSGEIATWIEIDPMGTKTRTLGCANGLQPRLHDMIAQPDGSYWLLCDEIRTVDLSAQGSSATARVLGTGVQHRAATGEVLFRWSPFDHLTIELSALEPSDLTGSSINWTHGNAIDLDRQGNLLVSFRNLSEVIKIDTRTGEVVWRMGGRRNQFSFGNVPLPPFARQHGVRADGDGRLLLLDNLGEPEGSRVEHYTFDEATRSATLTASYTSAARLIAQIGGNTQPLTGGNTLVSFGNGGGVEEYDAAGTLVWKLTGTTGYVFRAQRIRSLYQPGVGDSR